MELITAARRWLLTLDDVRGYVDSRVYKYRLEEHVDGTGLRAIVLRYGSGWAARDPINTAEFPTLLVDFWADASRDPDGNMIIDDAISNALAMNRALKPHIHGLRDEWWGAGGTSPGLRIISAHSWGEPIIETARDVHVGAGGDVPKGESAVVTTTYALHVAP